MEYRNPPHTNPWAGAFLVTPSNPGWGAEGFGYNIVQKRPVLRDAIDTSIDYAFIHNAYEQQDNIAHVSPDLTVEYIPSPPNVTRLSSLDAKFRYSRTALPEGAEDYFSDFQVQITGKKITCVRVLERNGPDEGFTDSGPSEQSREDVSVTVNFNQEGPEVEVEATDLNFILEETLHEYDTAPSGPYLKKITLTTKGILPNDDLADNNAGYSSIWMQFDVTGLRTFFDQ